MQQIIWRYRLASSMDDYNNFEPPITCGNYTKNIPSKRYDGYISAVTNLGQLGIFNG